MKVKKHLSFTCLRTAMSQAFRSIPDWRQAQKVSISLHDSLMSGFACMHFQDPSLLQFQTRLQEEQQQNNLQRLFSIEQIPRETQMREIIDGVDSDYFRPIFKDIYSRLQRGKHLERYQLFPNIYYFPMDGTQFYRSKEIHCEQCLVKKHKEGSPSYSHQVLQAGIAHPDCSEVIPFMPEQIVNTDGSTKQDCEMNAAKRFMGRIREEFPQLGLLVGGDALFSKQPIIEDILGKGMHYLFVAKPLDHTYMMDWLSAYPQLERLEFEDEKGRWHLYEWKNGVPLNGQENTVQVNFLRGQITGIDKLGVEKIVYKNSWVTDLKITDTRISTLVRAGRCRWKTENELFNVMKNHGYYMERNYGHGRQNLAFNFYLLTLLAFTFHQVFELTCPLYQANRKKFGSKKSLWETLRGYMRIIIFESWEILLQFALKPSSYDLVPHGQAP